MKADYVHKDTRTIVVDGVEIQTSLSAVEIADLHQKNQELHNKIDKAIEYINDTLCCIHDEELLDDLLEYINF